MPASHERLYFRRGIRCGTPTLIQARAREVFYSYAYEVTPKAVT
ncbi:MAG: hypothetical protein Ct9H300mP13_1420 [Gammaproteobacteria bacterium]|nr:MAG: hypothetical protein Ct9H300mP13_1420 [Gammaproteobacteria bacterium]